MLLKLFENNEKRSFGVRRLKNLLFFPSSVKNADGKISVLASVVLFLFQCCMIFRLLISVLLHCTVAGVTRRSYCSAKRWRFFILEDKLSGAAQGELPRLLLLHQMCCLLCCSG
mmetsp:Transcript_29372/g.62993  ORF Transcript_29372/g.62993 Transcript_29372/m.62993 type:complete len:114 (-) Transcript_29372:27-368(-)